MLQMANDRLNRLTALQAFSNASRNPAPLPRDADRTVYLIVAAIAAIQKHLLDALFTQCSHLVQRTFQCMSVIRIARQGHPADHETAAVGHRNTGLDPEFVTFVRLALADALYLRRMHTVQLVGAVFLLCLSSNLVKFVV